MELSARNQMPGEVVSITLGGVMAKVVFNIGNGNTGVAAVTRASVEATGIKEGDEVVAIIKATEVIVGKRA